MSTGSRLLQGSLCSSLMIDDDCSCNLPIDLNVVNAVVPEDGAEQSHWQNWA